MTDKIKQARETFDNGFNCAQSVLSTFAPERGLPSELSISLASALGGGMGRMGNVCGAVSGAVLTIGLAASKTKPEKRG